MQILGRTWHEETEPLTGVDKHSPPPPCAARLVTRQGLRVLQGEVGKEHFRLMWCHGAGVKAVSAAAYLCESALLYRSSCA